LELSLQRREREVEELQAEVVRLNDHYRESYQEAQDLLFELARIAFRAELGHGQVRGVGRRQLIGACTPFVTLYA